MKPETVVNIDRLFEPLSKEDQDEEIRLPVRYGYTKTVAKRFWMHKTAVASLVLLGFAVLAAVLVPLVSPYSYEQQNIAVQNAGSSLAHLFGTDKFGRDIFTRVWYGAGISLFVGFTSAFLNLLIGLIYGSVAGYVGGVLDLVMMRLADMIYAIPSLLYMILIMLVFGSNAASVLIGLCIAGWIELARVVRSEMMRLKQQEFCMAARIGGAGPARIIFRHLLINAIGPVIVTVTWMIPQAMFAEAFLSFVGVGISAPLASLGTLIQDARSQFQLYPMQMLYPIVVLCVIIFSLHFIGNALADAVDAEKG